MSCASPVRNQPSTSPESGGAGVRRFLKNNWPYAIMLIFIIVVSASIFMAGKKEKLDEEKKEEPYRIELMDEEVFRERQQKIEKLYYDNLPLYLVLIAVNLSIFLLFFGGICLNILAVYKWKKKETLIKKTISESPVRWDILDVIKFAIIFYSFAYLFMIGESKLVRIFPGLNNTNFMFIFNATIMDIAGILFVLNFVIWIYGQNLEAIGITIKNFFKNVFYGIAGYVAVVPILVVTLVLTAIVLNLFKYRPPVQPIVDMLMKEKEVPILVYSSIFAAVAGPIMEEIFFRGFMYNAFKKRIGIFWGILFTSSVFSLLHAHLVGFLPILILGIVLTYLYEKTGSLVPSMTVHILHNLASLLMVFVIKTLRF